MKALNVVDAQKKESPAGDSPITKEAWKEEIITMLSKVSQQEALELIFYLVKYLQDQ